MFLICPSWADYLFKISPSLFSSQMQTDTTGNNVLIIDILTIAYTVQVHQISMSVNLWAEFSRFNNKSSIRASKPLLISTGRNMQNNITDSEIIFSFISVIKNRFNAGQLFARDPPWRTKRSKELNMVGINKSQEPCVFPTLWSDYLTLC